MKSNEEVKKSTKQAIEKKGTAKKQNSAKKNVSKKVEESSVKKEKNTSTKSNTKKSETIKKGSTKNTTNKNTTKKATTTVKKEKINEPKKIEKVEQKEDLKKENTKQTVINQSEKFITKEETRKVGIVVAVIAAAFCIFFIASKIMDKNNHKDIFKESLDVAEIQYKDILISKMLKQKQSEYYVLVEYSKDENLETYEGYIKNYEENYSKENVLRIYTAQLNNAFNKSYYSDEDSYEIDKLSFSKTTLVKVSNGNITETYTGNDISIKIQGLIGEASN